MKFEAKRVDKDLVVIGGGMPGIVAAIQAARLGLQVALVCDRGFLGGNASAEIRVIVEGANASEWNFYSREGGIIEEIRLENLYRNPQGNPYIWDTVLRDFVNAEPNIELFLETNVDEVHKQGHRTIEYVAGSQQDSESRFYFQADLFLDNTGDGTVGYLAEADYLMGREGRDEFNERLAPEKPDSYVLPSTLTFIAKDMGRPITYIAPKFAMDIEKTNVLEYRTIPQAQFHRWHWYYELGGTLDQIKDIREIVSQHLSLVYGIWDHIKNSGKYDATNYDLEYVSCIPGKRESRRLIGDYLLTEGDLVNQQDFHDVIGHGGWTIDLHAIEGFFATEPINSHVTLRGIYQIPYRCCYSRNIDNLFMAGRNMSTSHVAFGSTRVIATLCTVGQGVGAAASLCKKYGIAPRQVFTDRIEELQQLLLREDQYVVGVRSALTTSKATKAKITSSSEALCALTAMDYERPLDRDLILILPVESHINDLSLLLKSSRPTTLQYEVYGSQRKYSYHPDKLVLRDSISLSKREDFQWVTLPLDLSLVEDKIILKIKANDAIAAGASKRSLPGVLCLQKVETTSPRLWDVETLKPKEFAYHRRDCLCFRISPNEGVYRVDNIVNGYARPYGLPNLWMSTGTEDQWIELDFGLKETISEVNLYFDSNFDFRIRNLEIFYDHNVIPSIVRDYDLLYAIDGKWELLQRVRGNYQRRNRLQFEPLSTDKIRLQFHATNGGDSFGLYELRVH
jgi:hypothetical protein